VALQTHWTFPVARRLYYMHQSAVRNADKSFITAFAPPSPHHPRHSICPTSSRISAFQRLCLYTSTAAAEDHVRRL